MLDSVHQSAPLIRGTRTDATNCLGQRMLAPRFRVPPHQRTRCRVQKQRFDGNAFLDQRLKLLGHDVQRCCAADIHGDGDMGRFLFLLQRHKLHQQLGRQIVHTVITRIFQRMQCHGFARARHASDQNNFHSRRVGLTARHLVPRLQHLFGMRKRRARKPLATEHAGDFSDAFFALH